MSVFKLLLKTLYIIIIRPIVNLIPSTVNFEKPSTQCLEGISTVHQSTPPNCFDKSCMARGYSAITVTVANARVPVTSYAELVFLHDQLCQPELRDLSCYSHHPLVFCWQVAALCGGWGPR